MFLAVERMRLFGFVLWLLIGERRKQKHDVLTLEGVWRLNNDKLFYNNGARSELFCGNKIQISERINVQSKGDWRERSDKDDIVY